MGTHPIFESDFDCLTVEMSRTRVQDAKMEGELLALTYGAIVARIMKDTERCEEANNQLDKMGKNMEETAEVLREAFRQYLNISPRVTNWNSERDSFSLILDNNPLTDFVELPSELAALNYCQMICGVIRGALEMVQLEVTAKVEKDALKGSGSTEIRICFVKKLQDAMPVGED